MGVFLGSGGTCPDQDHEDEEDVDEEMWGGEGQDVLEIRLVDENDVNTSELCSSGDQDRQSVASSFQEEQEEDALTREDAAEGGWSPSSRPSLGVSPSGGSSGRQLSAFLDLGTSPKHASKEQEEKGPRVVGELL